MTNAVSRLKRPRRTLNRIALALLAIGLAAIAQSSLRQGGVWDGLILFVVAAILFVWAVGRTSTTTLPRLVPYRGLFSVVRIRPGPLGWTGAFLIGIAALISYVGQQLFFEVDTWSQAWFYYATSVVLLIVGTLLLHRPSRTRLHVSASSFSFSRETIGFLVIFAVAIVLRLWRFDSLPFGVWFDEALAGLQARRWLEEASYKPAFYDPINISGQFLILYATALNYVSDTVHGIRFVSVLFGLGGVWMAYLFGKTIQGPFFGLLMAFFMAVMRWHINFSRIAMTGVDAPFFELMSLYFLARLFRHGHIRDAIFAGMALSLGLSFYTAFRLFVLALGVFFILAILIWRHWWGRARSLDWWSNQIVRSVVLTLALVIVLMPIMQYARRNPDSFSNRIETTSIFNRRDDPNLQRALRNSLLKHVGMLHYQGDKNGRHNLPGEPMLDPGMGILLVLGLGLGIHNLLSRHRRPANLFFLLLIPASFVGGVFSLDFEAPQSLRSISILPALAYFCALPVASLYREARQAIQPLSPNILWWPAGAAAFYVLGFNAYTYFVRQADDFAVWNAYSTAETVT
ncbi:MAG: hypothetical protein AAF629_19430, partial [Chloroflexota bacterium]